jgi:23S rRNA (cytidine1920-2'-O)/16S rRNA (cytidine1409-2'-O)-methyltransferase
LEGRNRLRLSRALHAILNPMKLRLDQLIVARGLAETRSKAQALLLAGSVRVDGQVQSKPGTMVDETALVEVTSSLPYASRGGYKLAHALDMFALDPAGLVCLDVGASTGGFTDVLLQRGAARVYAIDVGYGILDYRLRNDPRVVVLERTNIRHLEVLPVQEAGGRGQEAGATDTGSAIDDAPALCLLPASGASDLPPAASGASDLPPAASEASDLAPVLADAAVIDVSFISLKIVLPAVQRLIEATGWIVALIKPQFEAGAEHVGKGGVVRDPKIHRMVLREALAAANELGLTPRGLTRSPITGPAGNVEFLAWFQAGGQPIDSETAITNALP